MISKTTSTVVSNAYQSQTKLNDTKVAKQEQTGSKATEMSKVDRLKEAIGSGEYKVDIDALAEKVAESLL